MTTLGAVNQRERSDSAASPRRVGPAVVWGLDAVGLHDRRWASRRVQVVRASAGADSVDTPGPAFYLLLDSTRAALFDLAPVIRRVNWLKPRAVRLRILDTHESPYREHVEADENDRLVRIRRDYLDASGSRTRSTDQVILTPDARLAKQWAEHPGGVACRRAVYKACGKESVANLSVTGMTGDLRDPDAADRILASLISTWRRPEAVIDGVYLFAPGVWVHERAEIDPAATLVGPLWIGAGMTLDAGSALIGPRVAPDRSRLPIPAAPAWEDLTTATWRLTSRRLTPRKIFGKRAFDIAFSLCVLAATLPLYPVIMLAILIEDGWPPFFSHRRQTVRGREFPCLKFRTMRKNAEALKAELAALNQADGPQFFIEDDPRMLRVGKVLRATQLDEIPQFINVLLGHMSVVGPRPSPDKENQYCPAWREARLSVRPGVTGLWQVRRTREPQTDFQEWIRYDLEYVQRRSWRLDLVIILKTFTKIFGG